MRYLAQCDKYRNIFCSNYVKIDVVINSFCLQHFFPTNLVRYFAIFKNIAK